MCGIVAAGYVGRGAVVVVAVSRMGLIFWGVVMCLSYAGKYGVGVSVPWELLRWCQAGNSDMLRTRIC